MGNVMQLEPGVYQIDVALAGGTGKAHVQSPCEMIVEDGKAEAVIVWSSSNYDYMIVESEMYTPEYVNDKSVFKIPILVFDEEMEVVADTTAMSTPHEIEYTLTFDSSTIAGEGAADEKPAGLGGTAAIAIIAVLIIAAAGIIFTRKKKANHEEN